MEIEKILSKIKRILKKEMKNEWSMEVNSKFDVITIRLNLKKSDDVIDAASVVSPILPLDRRERRERERREPWSPESKVKDDLKPEIPFVDDLDSRSRPAFSNGFDAGEEDDEEDKEKDEEEEPTSHRPRREIDDAGCGRDSFSNEVVVKKEVDEVVDQFAKDRDDEDGVDPPLPGTDDDDARVDLRESPEKAAAAKAENSRKKSFVKKVGKRSYIVVGRWRCPLCGQRFSEKELLRKHKKVKHRSDIHPYHTLCRICHISTKEMSNEEGLNSKALLLHHFEGEHPVDITICKSIGCKDTFTSPYFMRIHFRRKHVKREHKEHICPACDMKFEKKVRLDEHMKAIHDEEGTSYSAFCSVCKINVKELIADPLMENSSFTLNDLMHRHYDKEHPTGLTPCRISTCAETFVRPSQMHHHYNVYHLKQKAFPCEFCPRQFSDNKRLRYHRDLQHADRSETPNSFLCPFPDCVKAFTCKQNVNYHVKTTHPAKPLKTARECGICKKKVVDLKNHVIALHDLERRLPCYACGKTFSNRSLLRRHVEQKHEGRVTFDCAQCGKVLGSPTSLRAHVRGVHEKKRHECEVCGKSYWKLGDMTSHVRAAHLGLKEKCRFPPCQMEFGRAADRNRHERKTHMQI